MGASTLSTKLSHWRDLFILGLSYKTEWRLEGVISAHLPSSQCKTFLLHSQDFVFKACTSCQSLQPTMLPSQPCSQHVPCGLSSHFSSEILIKRPFFWTSIRNAKLRNAKLISQLIFTTTPSPVLLVSLNKSGKLRLFDTEIIYPLSHSW